MYDLQENTIERIRILPEAYEKMFNYARYSKGEISGLGRIVLEKDELVVEKIYLLKQVCNTVHTVFDTEAHSKFICSIIKKGLHPKDFNFWWHSHYDFDVFFSGEDESTIDYLSREGRAFSVCINQKGMMIGRMDEKGVTKELSIVITPRSKLLKCNKYKKEIKRKVSYENLYQQKGGTIDELSETTDFSKYAGIIPYYW